MKLLVACCLLTVLIANKAIAEAKSVAELEHPSEEPAAPLITGEEKDVDAERTGKTFYKYKTYGPSSTRYYPRYYDTFYPSRSHHHYHDRFGRPHYIGKRSVEEEANEEELGRLDEMQDPQPLEGEEDVEDNARNGRTFFKTKKYESDSSRYYPSSTRYYPSSTRYYSGSTRYYPRYYSTSFYPRRTYDHYHGSHGTTHYIGKRSIDHQDETADEHRDNEDDRVFEEEKGTVSEREDQLEIREDGTRAEEDLSQSPRNGRFLKFYINKSYYPGSSRYYSSYYPSYSRYYSRYYPRRYYHNYYY